MTDVTKYYLAFSTIPGIGPARLDVLINFFGSAKNAWNASEKEISQVGLPPNVLAEFLQKRKTFNVEEYIQKLQKSKVQWLTIEDDLYPTLLKQIPNPPNVLFLRTNLTIGQFNKLTSGKIIGIVGTRKVTSYGKEITAKLTADLVQMGFVIVSGMALGVDGIAHGTTINCGGKTIAVLGAGVNVVYPPEHRDLYQKIIDSGGAIVSEVAPEKTVIRGVFPARNRIISGLSQSLLVTEGAIDSGSLITARMALEQGREVFAVPGQINSPMAQGTNYLLKQGAKLVTDVHDIVSDNSHISYTSHNSDTSYTSHDSHNGDNIDKKLLVKPVGKTKEEQKIIDLLFLESREFDEMVRETGTNSANLSAILSKLELEGKIHSLGLKYFLS